MIVEVGSIGVDEFGESLVVLYQWEKRICTYVPL